jgi:ribonuclease HI
MDFYWNIGITTNNKGEAYAIYQELQLEKKRQISNLNIVGDSKNTTRYFVFGSSSKDIGLKILVEHIKIFLLNLKVQFFHVYHDHNSEVDAMENRVIGLAPGLMWVDGIGFVVTPPP